MDWTSPFSTLYSYFVGQGANPAQATAQATAVASRRMALPPGQAAGAPMTGRVGPTTPVVAPPAPATFVQGQRAPLQPPPKGFTGPQMPNVPGPVSDDERAGILAQFAGGQDPNVPGPVSPEERAGILAQFSDGPGPQDAPQPAPQAPQAPQGPNKGAIYDGLINAGVGLMRGKNFGDAIANGFAGFNSAYDAKVQQDKDQASPKVVPLADGAFSMLVYPNGTQKVVPNKDIQKYQADKMKAQAELVYGKQQNESDLQLRNKRTLADDKNAQSADEELQQVQKSIDATQQAIEVAKHQGYGAQIAAKFPTLAGVFDPNDASGNQVLQNAGTDAWLSKTKLLKGALSDKEGARIASTLPDISADRPEVWLPFLQKQLDGLTRAQQFLQTQRSGGRTTGGNAPASSSNALGVSDDTYSNYFMKK
jgi:hypothetical protein